METAEIRDKVRQIIFETTNIEPSEIGEHAHFVDDLDLDSLTLLEIGVNVDQEFRLDLPGEEMKAMVDLQATVDLVIAHLEKKAVG
jgi:acyl carrier protein